MSIDNVVVILVISFQFSDLPGKGSFPTNNCSREDCDFYFRWGINPNNSNYLTIFISANLTQGWAAIGVSPDRKMVGIIQNMHLYICNDLCVI